MGRHAKYTHAAADGRVVGYSPKPRQGLFRVVFGHPTEVGKYVEEATGVEVPRGWNRDKSPPHDFHAAARQAIERRYSPARDAADPASPARLSWEQAEGVALDGITKAGSVRTYRSALKAVRTGLAGTAGPADVTPELAKRFAREYAAAGFARSPRPGAAVRPRSARTLNTLLRNLSVVWERLRLARAVAANPWKADRGSPDAVPRPKVPVKLPRVPSEAAVAALLGWLDRRFPGPDGRGWPLLRAYIEVKMLAGCRLTDLASARANQLDPRAGTLRIAAEDDKTHRERLVHLPPSLVARLASLVPAGAVYLWERYAADTAVYRPGRRRSAVFTPALMKHAVESAFKEYNKQANPDMRVRTHDLRKRAITMAAVALDGNLEAVARAFPVTQDTARRHYLDAKTAFDAKAIQERLAAVLLPPAGGSGAAGAT